MQNFNQTNCAVDAEMSPEAFQTIQDRQFVKSMIKHLLPRTFHVSIEVQWKALDEHYDEYTASATHSLPGSWFRIESAKEQLEQEYTNFLADIFQSEGNYAYSDVDPWVSMVSIKDDLGEDVAITSGGCKSGNFTWLAPITDMAEREAATARLRELNAKASFERGWDNFTTANQYSDQARTLVLRLQLGEYFNGRSVLWPTSNLFV